MAAEQFIENSIIRESLRSFDTTLWKNLLCDRTTGRNLIWGTSEYSSNGDEFFPEQEIALHSISGIYADIIRPRVHKSSQEQSIRTRMHAEVFTPAWIVNQMNNYCDAEWFGRGEVFNVQNGQNWEITTERIIFPEGKNWENYVDSRRLEITCGEVPYIVSRYDMATGEIIPVEKRVGILDRKLRIVNENTSNEKDWLKWAYRAFESVYGYEYQGDNLLIARLNLLLTFAEYLENKWQRQPDEKELRYITRVISWNFWQMDGIQDTVPLGSPGEVYHQLSLFEEEEPEELRQDDCKIYDWRGQKTLLFRDLKEGLQKMKFDFVIGNPPYQEDVQNKGDRPNPIYDKFIDAANSVGQKVCLIHPARFLFNAGQTSKQWNEKMLNDSHFKVLYYQPDATVIFPNTDIKGGVAITYHDSQTEFEKIGVFTPYNELNAIVRKVTSICDDKNRLNTIIASQGLYRFSDLFFSENPDVTKIMGAGTGNKIVSSIMEKLPNIFLKQPSSDGQYIRFLGRVKNKRTYRYILKKYLEDNNYIDCYNLFLPEANNSGHFGEVLTEPTIGYPNDGSADTFLSAGLFESETEPKNMIKYIKTKFFRALLGVKKVTQHCPPTVWSMIPLQDFTENSDIDWTVSVAEIDRQLYRKYGLTPEEIDFIETHVKEME